MKFFTIIYVFLVSFSSISTSNILLIAPMPTHSHFTLLFGLAEELVKRGHEVCFVSPFPQKSPVKNYKDIPMPELLVWAKELKEVLVEMDNLGPLANSKLIFDIGLGLAERVFMNENVQALIKTNETFDVVIMEQFANDAMYGFAHHFNVPLVIVSALGGSSLVDHVVGNPAPSSYVSNIMLGLSSKQMNFWERLQNFVISNSIALLREYYYMPQHRKLFKKYMKSDHTLDDIVYNVSLILSNTHVSVHDAVPLVPNLINIGGFHVKAPNKLPEDLQDFLDNSKDGVILFAMGSNLRLTDLNQKVCEMLSRAFSKVKQNILWKLEKQLPGLPSNVKVVEWLPQQDVLAHRNIRAFISHGGMLSIIEAVHFGVPIIGIPIYADQMANVAMIASKESGVSVSFKNLTEERFIWVLDEIQNNPKYRKNMQQLSRLMKDRPLQPMDEAIYWVEHVIRHKGAPHLRTAALDLKWYQREMIDIIVFLATVSAIICMVLFLVAKKTYELCNRHCSEKKAKKNKQKKL